VPHPPVISLLKCFLGSTPRGRKVPGEFCARSVLRGGDFTPLLLPSLISPLFTSTCKPQFSLHLLTGVLELSSFLYHISRVAEKCFPCRPSLPYVSLPQAGTPPHPSLIFLPPLPLCFNDFPSLEPIDVYPGCRLCHNYNVLFPPPPLTLSHPPGHGSRSSCVLHSSVCPVPVPSPASFPPKIIYAGHLVT